MTPSDSLKARVLASVAREKSPPRKSQALRGAALAACAVTLMVIVLAIFGGPADSDARPLRSGAFVVLGSIAIALAATWLALPRRGSMLSRPPGTLLAAVAIVPLAIAALTMLSSLTYADAFHRFGARCFALTLLTAPWPFAALAYARGRLDPVRPSLTGAALGAASGAWASVMVGLFCPLAEAGHVFRGHLAPMLVLVGLGALLGSRVFSVGGARQ